MGIMFLGQIVELAVVCVLKAGAYWAVFRWRTIQATAMDCLRIGGFPLLIGFIPIPWPSFVPIVLSIALAVALTMLSTEASFIPDGLFIPVGIEIAYPALLWGLSQLAFVR
jgi:hypothetical protein